MKRSIKKYLLLSFSICLLMGAASCEKDEDVTVPDKVTLLSFGPSGSKHGDKISFIGYHLDRVTAIELAGATVDAKAFAEQKPDHIVITVPQETEKGKVTLKAQEGDVISKTSLNLDVEVVISSIPATAAKGTNITIKGTFVNWITKVTFGGDEEVTEFVSKSLTELVLKVPANATTGTLIFSIDGTEPEDIESEQELVIQ